LRVTGNDIVCPADREGGLQRLPQIVTGLGDNVVVTVAPVSNTALTPCEASREQVDRVAVAVRRIAGATKDVAAADAGRCTNVGKTGAVVAAAGFLVPAGSEPGSAVAGVADNAAPASTAPNARVAIAAVDRRRCFRMLFVIS
jgi:hypothetical protein